MQAAKIVGPAGRVLAVEPQGRLQEVIQKNLELNGLTNVTLVRSAVSDRLGEAELHISPTTNTGSTGLSQSIRYRVPHEAVPVNTLEAITSADRNFREKRVKPLALEMHPELMRGRDKEPEKIEASLRNCGYRQDPEAKTNVWIA